MGLLFIVCTGNGTGPQCSARELGRRTAAQYGGKNIEVIIGVGVKAFEARREFLAGYGGTAYGTWEFYPQSGEVIRRALLEGLHSKRHDGPAAAWRGIGSMSSRQDIVNWIQCANTSPEIMLVFLTAEDLPPVLDRLQPLRDGPLDAQNVIVVRFDGDAIWCEQPPTLAPLATPAA